MSGYLRDQIAHTSNIEEHQALPKEFTGGIGVDGLRCSAGTHHQIDAAFLFVGASPAAEWLPVERDEKGFIRTHDGFETSVEGIYAAGDIRSGSYKRVTVAVGEGAGAATEIYLKRRDQQWRKVA